MGFRRFGEPFGRGRFARPVGQGGGGSGVAAIVYTLRDLFTTPLAGGAVNGTAAEPTGQTRTVTDGNSKLSITGNTASIATGGVGAAGDPGIWYPSIVRQVGLTLFMYFVQTTNTLEVGWDSAAAGSILFSFRPIVGSALNVKDNGGNIAVGAALSTATTYQIAISLRSSGCWYFIKGGAFTFWTLIWISASSSINLLPGATVNNSNDVFNISDLRVPVALIVPNPLAYDTFTRANGALGSTETAGPDAQVIAALTWLFTAGIWTIATNKAVATPVLGADVIVNGGFGADSDWTKGANWTIAAGLATGAVASSDLTAIVAPLTVGVWYQITYTLSGFGAGTVQVVVGGVALPTHGANGTFTEIARAGTTAFLMRGAGFTGSVDNVSAKPLTTAELLATVLYSSADVIIDKAVTLSAALNGLPDGIVVNLDNTVTPANFILVYLDGKGNCVCEECVAGVFTVKFTTAITYSAGAVLRVIRDGTSLRVFYNSSLVSTVQTMTANVNLRHGMFGVSALNSGDNVTIWARGKGNEYIALDSY